MFYGFPTQEGAPHGVKVAMHFNDSNSNKNRCTPQSLDKTLRKEDEEEVKNELYFIDINFSHDQRINRLFEFRPL